MSKKEIHGACKNNERELLYDVWSNMKARCDNPNLPNYKNYGAKGVSYCDEWKTYLPFKEWALANGYEKGLTIDKDIGSRELNISPAMYSPETCRWSTYTEQQQERNTI